jgi:hypothetical protein
MTEPLTNDTVIMLAVIALVAICVIAWNLRWAFERPVEVDEDELADRIETAIGDATRDLLGVLEEIRDSNQAILDDSRADELVGSPARVPARRDHAAVRVRRPAQARLDKGGPGGRSPAPPGRWLRR